MQLGYMDCFTLFAMTALFTLNSHFFDDQATADHLDNAVQAVVHRIKTERGGSFLPSKAPAAIMSHANPVRKRFR